MQNYFKKYHPFLQFLAVFFISYFLLTGLYRYFIDCIFVNQPDPITHFVTEKTIYFLRFFDSTAHYSANFEAKYYKIFYHSKFIVRVVEGCNVMSILIIFNAFLFAFYKSFLKNFVFAIIGSFVLFFLNIFRIVAIVILIDKFPNLEHMLHGVVFPAIIYGLVFLFWIFWINRFVKNEK